MAGWLAGPGLLVKVEKPSEMQFEKQTSAGMQNNEVEAQLIFAPVSCFSKTGF